MRYAVIMAGGAGKRLWPISRLDRPKQLLPLVEGRCLLEIAVERCESCFAPENIYVITNAEYAPQIREALPKLPAENVVGEPIGRDTANAIALAAEILAARDPSATMAVFTADHVIRPVEQFAKSVDAACNAAESNRDALVTFGIKPSWPHTGLGYVHSGGADESNVHKVQAFKEKPDCGTAEEYVACGEYFWNSGMFVWTLDAIRSELNKHLPQSMADLAPIGKAVAQGSDYSELLGKIYPGLEKISIDFAIMEKASTVLMVELGCEWLDVGSWPAVEQVCELDQCNNAILSENTFTDAASGNIVVCEDDHLLALLGVNDCVIVHTPDATLVASKHEAYRLKELLEEVENTHGSTFS